MRALEDIYPNIFFKDRHKLSWRTEPICNAIVDVLKPKTVIDCGAAIGDIVKTFNDKGVECRGIEGSKKAKKYLVCNPSRMSFLDLRLPICKEMDFDLCTCFEVAEHIEEEFVEIFLDNLTHFSDKIVISICEEGGGRHHVNEKPMAYWHDLFEEYGYYEHGDITESLRKKIAPHCKNFWLQFIHDRIHYFERRK
jgi:hypothetical protein